MDDYSDDDVETIDCSACGKSIYEDAESCHYCGEFIVRDSSFLSQRKPWVRVLWILVVAFLIYTMMGMWF